MKQRWLEKKMSDFPHDWKLCNPIYFNIDIYAVDHKSKSNWNQLKFLRLFCLGQKHARWFGDPQLAETFAWHWIFWSCDFVSVEQTKAFGDGNFQSSRDEFAFTVMGGVWNESSMRCVASPAFSSVENSAAFTREIAGLTFEVNCEITNIGQSLAIFLPSFSHRWITFLYPNAMLMQWMLINGAQFHWPIDSICPLLIWQILYVTCWYSFSSAGLSP